MCGSVLTVPLETNELHLLQEKFKLEVEPGNHTSDPPHFVSMRAGLGAEEPRLSHLWETCLLLSSPVEDGVERQSHFHGEPVLCSDSRADERKGSG